MGLLLKSARLSSAEKADLQIDSDWKIVLFDVNPDAPRNASLQELTTNLYDLLDYTRNLKALLENQEKSLEYKLNKFRNEFCDLYMDRDLCREIVCEQALLNYHSAKSVLYVYLNNLHIILCDCLITRYANLPEKLTWFDPKLMNKACWTLLPKYMPNLKHIWEPYYAAVSLSSPEGLLGRMKVYHDWRVEGEEHAIWINNAERPPGRFVFCVAV